MMCLAELRSEALVDTASVLCHFAISVVFGGAHTKRMQFA